MNDLPPDALVAIYYIGLGFVVVCLGVIMYAIFAAFFVPGVAEP